MGLYTVSVQNEDDFKNMTFDLEVKGETSVFTPHIISWDKPAGAIMEFHLISLFYIENLLCLSSAQLI